MSRLFSEATEMRASLNREKGGDVWFPHIVNIPVCHLQLQVNPLSHNYNNINGKKSAKHAVTVHLMGPKLRENREIREKNFL